MKRFLSPKQAAQSMGVSESSLKRWCDRGTLQAHLTAGGHRKIPVNAVVQFVRENRQELIRPELLGLPPKRKSETADLASSVLPLADALVEGHFESSRQVLFSHFLQGLSVAKLCDELLAPALAHVGKRWRAGDLEIYEEHRSVQLTHQLLSELHATISDPKSDAPTAIGGTPEHDVYGLPTRMIALALREAGWNATSLGTSLPFSTLLAAIQKQQPQLVWLSVSVLTNPHAFGVKIASFVAEIGENTTVMIGGRGLPHEFAFDSSRIIRCERIQQLVTHSQQLILNSDDQHRKGSCNEHHEQH